MTVLYFLISTDPYSGSTKSFLRLLTGIMQAGVKPLIVVPDTDGIYGTLTGMGAKVIVQYEKGCTWTGAKNLKQTLLYIPRQIGRMWINWRARRSLEKKLEGIDVDLVHSNSTVASLGRYIANRRRLPHLYHVREYGDKDFGLTYFPTNAVFRNHLRDEGTYTACITRDIQRHHGLEGLPSSRVIYNGILPEKAEYAPVQTERNFFLYAGRIEPTKGLLKLVKVYSLYAKSVPSPLPLKVAGEAIDSAYMLSVERCISTGDIGNLVVFLGKVDDMTALYQTAKAIVIPSENEGFGRCMPEAMSCGCIAVGHNTAGTQEQFDNGLRLCGTEIGLRYNDEEELLSALLRVHNMQEQEQKSLRGNAFRCVSSLYTDRAYTDSVLAFYKYILNEK
jgi:glycosyltransferase involved in cell wall biosynthesis